MVRYMTMLNHSYFIWNDPWDKKSLIYYRDIHSLSQKWVPLLGSLIQGFRIPAWGTFTSSLYKSYILIWFASRRSLRGVHSILFKFCEVPLQLFLFQHAKDFFSLYVCETLMTLIFREADISYILRKKLFIFHDSQFALPYVPGSWSLLCFVRRIPVQLFIALLYPFTFEMLSFKLYYLPYEVCYYMGSLVM